MEELLRFDSSVQMTGRVTNTEVEIGGVTLPADESVVMLLGAANRDPAHYDEPDKLDVGRQNVRPMSFGRWHPPLPGCAACAARGRAGLHRPGGAPAGDRIAREGRSGLAALLHPARPAQAPGGVALAMVARWRGEGGQHQGARPYQEDSWELRTLKDGSVLAVVADGMGGHAGGAVASRLVADAAVKAVEQGRSLSDGLQAANEAVREGAARKQELVGMGSTLVAVIVAGDDVRWISVGDSPFYMVSGGKLERLNADHSMAPQIDALVARWCHHGRGRRRPSRTPHAARGGDGTAADLDR